MQRSRYALAAALALALVPALGTASQRDVDKVMGSITAHAGEQYGDLTTVNGSIRVEKNAVARDATTVNGSIHIEEGGKVAAAETVNGSIRFDGRNEARAIETVNGGIRVGGQSKIGGIDFWRTFKACAPFLIPIGVVLIIVTFVPWVSLALPRLSQPGPAHGHRGRDAEQEHDEV